MMRLLCIATLLPVLTACHHSMPTSAGYQAELRNLLEFHESIQQQDEATLSREAARLTSALGDQDSASLRLQLALLETQLEHHQQLKKHQLQQDELEKQIKALSAQIEALTAIEQQINRRGQRQENGQ